MLSYKLLSYFRWGCVANEVVHSMKEAKWNPGGCALKIDFGKAYEWLQWNFLLNILEEMGLGKKWNVFRQLMFRC